MDVYNGIRKDIIDLLNRHVADEHELIDKINEIASKERGGFVRDIIKLITHLDFKEEESRIHWENIINHMQVIEHGIGRKVGLRVAMFDYFKNIKGHLKNPKFIEITEYSQTLERIFIDPLTGLFNRRYLQKFLDSEIKRSRRYKLTFSILMLDIDDFKTCNDRYGHVTGDKVLKDMACILNKESRGEDVAIRYGGEEFIINMPQTNKEGARIMAERLRKKVEERAFISEENTVIRLTISGGISTYPVDSENRENLIALSDRALYMAKALGKNRICVNPVEK